MTDILNPSFIDASLQSRAITFENPTGARGSGGRAAGGRKGAPSRVIGAGERVVLADLEGPGVLRHLWMTVLPAPPERLRAIWIEVFYDGADEPSVSVPLLDFFCLPHGRTAPFASALVAVNEGRGFNSTMPMPFAHHVRIELENGSDTADRPLLPDRLYARAGHAFLKRIPPRFVPSGKPHPSEIGPGHHRGFGQAQGVSSAAASGYGSSSEGIWYGEGEVKMFLDGDSTHPTICGTGLEDYVGSAWGMGRHATPYGGCTLDVRAPMPTIRSHNRTSSAPIGGTSPTRSCLPLT